MQQEETQAGDGGGRRDEDERGRGRDGRRRRRKERESDGRGRRAASEGGEETGATLRWRIHQLEKEKLELTSGHNRELCRLQVELTRLRSSVERGEAQGAELQYQLTLSQRDAARAAELSRDKRSLTERAAELQQTVQELQRALDITRQAREEDQHALQQEVEERDKLIHSLSSENQQLHQLLQEQEAALDERERRMEEAREEREKEAREVREERKKEAEANRRQADELKYLMEREERSRREKEASDQQLRSLESNIEAERAAHLESKFNSELVQLRVRDLEAAVAVERSGQQEAQCGLELLRAQLRQMERAHSLERERHSGTERALERLEAEYEQCKSDLGVAMETERKSTSDLSGRLEEEKKRHGDTCSRLQQTKEAHVNCVQKIRETLQQHNFTGCSPLAVHDGSSSAEVLRQLELMLDTSELRLKETEKQVQDLLRASELLQQENHTLGRLTSDQSRQREESREESVRLEEELKRLCQQSSDWSTQSRELRAGLQREREERAKEVQRLTDDYDKESKVRLSFLYCLYQRLLAGCVLLTQPHSILGNFTWKELCDVICEQVDRLTSDLQAANDKIARLQLVCEKKSMCVHKLQRALSRLEKSARRRDEARSDQHTLLQHELQVCRSECDVLRGQVSSLTSDLSLLSGGRKESASLLAACALLAGALRHAHHRLRTLCEQKDLVCRRLAESEALEEEVRRLAGALGGEEDEDEEEERGRRAVRRWRRSVWAVLAARRWRALAKETTVLFRLERGGGGPDVCVCGDVARATQEGQIKSTTDEDDGGREGVYARWIRSKRLSSTIVSSMADLQGALEDNGSSPPDVTAAARSSLSRLLDHLLDQSDAASRRADDGGNTLSWRLKLPPRTNTKALVSTLQQHFLLFSQRLHSAEVERRSLRLEAANLKKGLRREREDTCRTVPAERFHSVCAELRQALAREQEAQSLIHEQTERLHALQHQVNAQAAGQSDPQCTLSQTTQALSDARQEASRRKRTLRILGKHLSGVQSEKKQLEDRLRRAEGELRDATRRTDDLISGTKTSLTEVTVETPPLVPLPEQKEEESKPPVPPDPNPAPSSPVSKPPGAKMKKKKSVGHVKSSRRATDRFSVVV